MSRKSILIAAFALTLCLSSPVARASVLGKHGITLTWTASTTPGFAVYRIYRGTASGGPYTLVGITMNLYDQTAMHWEDADEHLIPRATYYYVVTAADWTNAESGYSNEASAVWP
ncbi:MAG: hypothetical protein ACRD19_12925 [Terriglobia bacterium]